MSDPNKPHSSIETFEYSDLAKFRPPPHLGRIDYTPTVKAINVEQTVLKLPGCEVCLLKTFPRTVDGKIAEGNTMVGFTMDDRSTIHFNGWKKNLPSAFIGNGGSEFKMAEESSSTLGIIMFRPGVVDRGWPKSTIKVAPIVTTAEAEDHLRQLLLAALEFALQSPADLAGAEVSLKESFFSAIDEAFLAKDSRETSRIAEKDSRFELISEMDAYLSKNVSKPIYSSGLAKHLGVSIRTLHGAVLQYRGTSPHRYLRMKRLWLVRQQLSAGAISVKACALANGFWHMGDFSRLYQSHFGEAPSQTLRQS